MICKSCKYWGNKLKCKNEISIFYDIGTDAYSFCSHFEKQEMEVVNYDTTRSA